MPKSPVLSFRVISSILNWTEKSQVNTHNIMMNQLIHSYKTEYALLYASDENAQYSKIKLHRCTELLPRYASSWSFVKFAGKTVGMPGMKVFSFSSPPQRERLFFFFSPPSELSSELLLSSSPRFQVLALAEVDEDDVG